MGRFFLKSVCVVCLFNYEITISSVNCKKYNVKCHILNLINVCVTVSNIAVQIHYHSKGRRQNSLPLT